MKKIFVMALLLILTQACKNKVEQGQEAPALTVEQIAEREKQVMLDLTKLKETAQEGDLITRLSDDMFSEQLKYFNDKDFAFSHSGIVVNKDGKKVVCSILPDAHNAVHYDPIDSFLIPSGTISCGLYRYELTPQEKSTFIAQIQNMGNRKIVFDSITDIHTNDTLYCSEMIYKNLKLATNNRVTLELKPLPQVKQDLIYKYFGGRVSKTFINDVQLMTLDNLYTNKYCKELMRFRIKYFPGE